MCANYFSVLYRIYVVCHSIHIADTDGECIRTNERKKGIHILSIYPPRHFPQKTKKFKKSLSREKRKKEEEQRTKFAATY